jgi:hypothetical protein
MAATQSKSYQSLRTLARSPRKPGLIELHDALVGNSGGAVIQASQQLTG